MTVAGVSIVVLSVLIGGYVGLRHGLDGLQTALCAALAWIVVSTLYHAARACLPRRGRRR